MPHDDAYRCWQCGRDLVWEECATCYGAGWLSTRHGTRRCSQCATNGGAWLCPQPIAHWEGHERPQEAT